MRLTCSINSAKARKYIINIRMHPFFRRVSIRPDRKRALGNAFSCYDVGTFICCCLPIHFGCNLLNFSPCIEGHLRRVVESRSFLFRLSCWLSFFVLFFHIVVGGWLECSRLKKISHYRPHLLIDSGLALQKLIPSGIFRAPIKKLRAPPV